MIFENLLHNFPPALLHLFIYRCILGRGHVSLGDSFSQTKRSNNTTTRMIISIVVISYSTGGVIFSRFYGHELHTESQQAEWLKKLRDATAPDWALLKEDHDEQVATIGEVQIVYKLIGDVVLMISGVEEHEALLLLQLSRSMKQVILRSCKVPYVRKTWELKNENVSVEKRILQYYYNLCMLVDEFIDDGDIDHLDSRTISNLLVMKPKDTIQNIRTNNQIRKQKQMDIERNQDL